MSSSPENQARSSEYERGWALLYRLIRLNGSLSGHERNVLYRNHGDGTFADLSAVAGLDFPEDGRAFVTFDFDRDGDVDILLNNRNSPQLRLLRNDLPTSHHSVAFRLEGTKSNRDAVGARLVLETASGRRLTRSVRSGSGFRSQPSRTVHFGLGEEEEIRELSIFWPSGTVERHREIPAEHLVLLKEGTRDVTALPFEVPPGPPPEPEAAEPEAGTSRTGIWLTEATPAPRLRGRSLDGEEFPPERYRGKRILLNFWATWCAPCQAELADFNERREDLGAAGLLPLLVSVDEPSEHETVRRYVRDKQLAFPVLLPDEDTVTAFDLLVRHILDQSAELAIPATFLINESGEILKFYLGRTTADQILEDVENWPGNGIELLQRALPFPGRAYVTRFERKLGRAWRRLRGRRSERRSDGSPGARCQGSPQARGHSRPPGELVCGAGPVARRSRSTSTCGRVGLARNRGTGSPGNRIGGVGEALRGTGRGDRGALAGARRHRRFARLGRGGITAREVQRCSACFALLAGA